MKIATCSFPEFKPEMGLPIRISRGYPMYRLSYSIAPDCVIRGLWPDRTYFKAPEAEFTDGYIADLERVGVDSIRDQITVLLDRYGQQTAVLLCFEQLWKKPFCHRRLFAEWWTANTGEAVLELGQPALVVVAPDPGNHLF